MSGKQSLVNSGGRGASDVLWEPWMPGRAVLALLERVIHRGWLTDFITDGLSLIRSSFMNWFWQKPIWFVNQIQFDWPNVYLMWNVYWQTFTLNLIVNYMASAPINLLFTSKQIMIYLKNIYKFTSDWSIFFDIVHKK